LRWQKFVLSHNFRVCETHIALCSQILKKGFNIRKFANKMKDHQDNRNRLVQISEDFEVKQSM